MVVPCFDEAARIDLDAFASIEGVSLLFIDDGSTDGTAAMLGRFAARRAGVAVIELGSNRGKGEAVRAGLRAAIEDGAEVVGYCDADLATPPDEIARLAAIAGGDGPEVVLGSRIRMLGHRIDRRAARHYLGRVYATVASWVLGVGVYDTQCGAKFFRVTPTLSAALDTPFADRWAFDVELLRRLLRPATGEAATMVEVPLRTWRDVAGSKVGVFAGARSLVALVRLRGRS